MCFVRGSDILPGHESDDSSIQETFADTEDGNKTGNDEGEDENDALRAEHDNINSKGFQLCETSQHFDERRICPSISIQTVERHNVRCCW